MYKGKYIQAINGFQFNCLRPATNLTVDQLATKLGIGRSSFFKLQKTLFDAPVVCQPTTYKNLIELINRYYLVFSEINAIGIFPPIPMQSKSGLTAFQYKVGIYLLYDANMLVRSSSLSFIDTYFRTLDNWEILEKHTNLLGLIEDLKKIMESKGLEFPDSYTVKYSKDLQNQKLTIEDIRLLFSKYLGDFIELEMKDLHTLVELLNIHRKSKAGESFKMDYSVLSVALNMRESAITSCIMRLRNAKLLSREIKEVEGESLYRGDVYIKLNLNKIAQIKNLLSKFKFD